MMLSPDDAKAITDRLLARSKADGCVVKIVGSVGANLRFARGNATTDGASSKLSVRVESHFGKRAGAAQASGLDVDALAEAVVRAEEIARLTPENPELMPPLGPQTYDPGAGYDAATAAVRVDGLAAATKPIVAEADEGQLKQVFWNLARNALQAMPQGGTLRTTLETNSNNRLRISFTDTGRGMSPDQVEHLFEPFSSTTGGTGRKG